MQKTIDYTNSKNKSLKMAVNKSVDNRKKKVEARIFALRNIASEALNDFIYNEYEGMK
jgi:hypothetical protein